ncbi:MAG: DUF4330 domain-containing protein [Clostridia bacterium]|nr:DUF4330 domain-containing protein [Clostridia bacterium]
MTIIDSKGKLFGKISIIDILIVVVLIGAIAGAGYKYIKARASNPFVKQDKVQITFYCEEFPEYAASEDNIKKGSLVKDGVQGTVLGAVTEVKTGKAISFAQSDKGEFNASSKQGYLSAYITAEGQGRYSDNGLIVNNVEYYVGQIVDKLRVGKSEFRYNVRIQDIKKIN